LISDDYVLGNSAFETYLQYSFNPKSSNEQNPNYKVNYCNLKIQVWRHLQPNSTVVFEKNFTSSDFDVNNAQYFFLLFDRDQVIATQTCYFQNTNYNYLDLPAQMQIIQPTFECKACQFYLWSKQEADITKAQIVGDNVVSISSYIQKLVILNFEIILILFWIALIMFIFIGIGLIFIGAYWLFIYLSRIAK
jgi:hypothetical protein